MTRPGVPSAVLAVVAVAASGAVIVATSSVGPTRAGFDLAPEVAPIAQAQLSCPESTTGHGVTTSLVAVAPRLGGNGADGRLSVHQLSTDPSALRKPVDETNQVGVPVATQLDAAAQPSVTVDAVGGLAPAAYAGQRTILNAGKDVGLAVASCASTADSWWFTGVDTAVGSTSRLVLSNPTPAVAVVDLAFYGPKGVVSAVGAKGIPVAPRSRQSLDLARFAPGLDAVAVHVKATRGRVSAAVDVARVNGITAAGNEWLAPSGPPSNDVLVNAGDRGDGDQRLVITNPSAREALVRVQVLEESGSFTPKSLAELRVRPGRTVVTDVSEATGTGASALHVTTGRGPSAVLATLISESTGPVVDLSSSSSSAELSGPAVIPVFRGSRLALAFASAQPGGGEVTVQAYDAQGRPVGDPTRIPVKASTTTASEPSTTPATAYLLATVTDPSHVQGVATYHGRTGVSAIPIVSTPTTITRPAVRPGS